MKRISPLTTSALLAGMISVCLLSACQSNDDRGQPMQTGCYSVDLQRYQAHGMK
jgi:major membrane immunogen (membrane-anchored lipoprotein)